MTIPKSRPSIIPMAAVCALLAAGKLHAQTPLEDIVRAKEVKIAIPTDFPPMAL